MVNHTGTVIYLAVGQRDLDETRLREGDLLDVRSVAEQHHVAFLEKPGGRIHPIQDQVTVHHPAAMWPARMYRALFLGESVIRILEELPGWTVFGSRGEAVVDLLDQYFFSDEIGQESYHQAEQEGRKVFRRLASAETETAMSRVATTGGAAGAGPYDSAARTLASLAQSSCPLGPLTLAFAIICRDELSDDAYEQLVHPYRQANIPFLENVE